MAEGGYHLHKIPRGTHGEFSKIEEEFHELKDAVAQGSKVMGLVELSDLLSAIKGYLKVEYGDSVTLSDLVEFSDITDRAFANGHRKAPE